MPTLNKASRFPALNSLRFIPANATLPTGYNTWPFDQGFFYQQIKSYFQTPVSYFQKVEASDTITIYFDSLSKHATFTLLNGDGSTNMVLEAGVGGTLISANNTDSQYGDQYYTYVYQFTPADIPLNDGYYCVAVQMTYDGDTDPLTNTIFISECFHLSNEGWDKTMLFEYADGENEYDVFFAAPAPFGGFTPLPWAFRCECWIDIDPTFHDTTFEDFIYQVQKLQSIPYRIGELNVGGDAGVPPWVLDKVNRILSCDTITIDGVQWWKEPGANWSFKKMDSFPMKAGTIKLRNNPASSAGEFEFNNYSGPGGPTFKIHDDVNDDVED